MALLFCDSFEHYQYGDFLKKWTTHSNNINTSFATDTSAPGGSTYLSMANLNATITKSLLVPAPGSAIGIVGGWFSFANVTTATNYLMGLGDSGTSQCDVRIDSAGHLLVTRNGTTLATSTNAISVNTWNHVELKATINNTTGTYELRVNGTSTNWVPAATGANTRATANNSYNQLLLSSIANGANTTRIKGIYIADSTGSAGNDFFGPCIVKCLRPSGAGNYAQWTANSGANFAAAGEVLGDGDATFNSTTTANNIDSFTFDDVPSGTGTVFGIQHVMECRQDAGAARQIAAFQRSSGSDYVGTTQNVSATHVFYTQGLSINPATSAGFAVSEVNGAEFGYKLIS